MNNVQKFQNAIKNTKEKMTYANVMEMFNDLNKTLRGEFYTNANGLKRPEGGTAIGFVYEGYAAGVGLRRILDTIGIKYSTFMKGGTGIEEKSEIHIDAKDEKRMADIFEKIGQLQSNLSHEINTQLANVENNPLFQQIR
jgi:hypothetical protein